MLHVHKFPETFHKCQTSQVNTVNLIINCEIKWIKTWRLSLENRTWIRHVLSGQRETQRMPAVSDNRSANNQAMLNIDSGTSRNQHPVPSGITCFNYFLSLISTSPALHFSLSKCLSIRIDGCDLYNVCVISCDEAFTGLCNLFFGEQINLIALGIIFDGSLAVRRVIRLKLHKKKCKARTKKIHKQLCRPPLGLWIEM